MPERSRPTPARLRGQLPASTYRLQLDAEFGFADAADLDGYLADLGVTHAYLSPILQAVPGSAHGYDVIDHSRISADLGGEEGLRYLAARLARRDIGLVADVVPNHMAIPAPEYLNRQLWSVLATGPGSPCAHWFDIDWAGGQDRLLLPILSGPLRDCLDDFRLAHLGELPGVAATNDPVLTDDTVLPDDTVVLVHNEHVLPVRTGTEALPMPDLLSAQHYRLDSWRTAASELNYRRFFDISSLIAIRVEEPDVFAATHGVLLGLVAEGIIGGLRIDHPDGLADPRDYLRQLATAASGSWIVAEKILAAGEELPADWQCAGTTGYDALAAVGEVFTDQAGAEQLGRLYAARTGDHADFAATALTARREVADGPLRAEVARLGRVLLRIGDPGLTSVADTDLAAVLAELLAAFTVYRAYAVPGEPPLSRSVVLISEAAAAARRRLPGRLHPAADRIAGLLTGGPAVTGAEWPAAAELIVRFQQVCAAVQAKGVEDTAAYRWTRLVCANEVGADPDRPGRELSDFHQFAQRLSTTWPASMTTLSTHDTKRQEDVRARLAVLAEVPAEWSRYLAEWHDRAAGLPGSQAPDPPTEYLLWQTLVGAWPLDDERLAGYLLKAMREAKLSTSWTEPDLRYEAAAMSFARRAMADPVIAASLRTFVAAISTAAAANSLGAKLVQLTMPGVPDVYQGCELTGLGLVDPDNRRPVDYQQRRDLLATIWPAGQDDGTGPDNGTGLDAAKLLVTSAALRLRRAHPDWFTASYQPLTAVGPAASHLVAFSRGAQVITVATRFPARLRRQGGWQDTTLPVPDGEWCDVLTGAELAADDFRAGVRLADLTRQLPVALLTRVSSETEEGRE